MKVTELYTLLRLPTEIFYKQCTKALRQKTRIKEPLDERDMDSRF